MNNQILFFDTETTGIPDWKTPSGGEDQPHIVQLAAVLVDEHSRDTTQSMNVIVQPDGWDIPQETIDVHGITPELANHVGVTENLALLMLLALMRSACKRVAYNTTFDNRIIRIGTKRYFTEEIQDEWHKGDYECAMIASRKIIGGKFPKLTAAYEYFTGSALDGAHDAMTDTLACRDVYFAIKDIEVSESI